MTTEEKGAIISWLDECIIAKKRMYELDSQKVMGYELDLSEGLVQDRTELQIYHKTFDIIIEALNPKISIIKGETRTQTYEQRSFNRNGVKVLALYNVEEKV